MNSAGQLWKIAEQTGQSAQKIGNLLAARKFDDRCQRLGIADMEDLDKSVKGTLNVLPDDSVFEALTRLAKDASMNTRDIAEVRKDIDGTGKRKGSACKSLRTSGSISIRRSNGSSWANQRTMPLSLRAGGHLNGLKALIDQEPDADEWLPKRDAARTASGCSMSPPSSTSSPLLDEALNDALGTGDEDEDDDADEAI